MRTLLLICATLGVFGTGCGGCVDDDNRKTPAPSPPNFTVAPRKYQMVKNSPDASLSDFTGADGAP